LAGALKTAKTKPMYFALVEKTQVKEGTLIVSKNPIPTKAITEAQKDLGGGGKIYKGRCVPDKTGLLIFETAKDPPATLAKTIKAVILRDAGLPLKVDTRKASDLVDDDSPDPAPASTGPSTTPKDNTSDAAAKADVAKRLAALMEAYKKAQSGGGPDAELLQKYMQRVKTAIEKKDYAAAADALDDLEEFLDQIDSEPNHKALSDKAYKMGYTDGESGQPRHAGKLIREGLDDYLDYYDLGYDQAREARQKK